MLSTLDVVQRDRTQQMPQHDNGLIQLVAMATFKIFIKH